MGTQLRVAGFMSRVFAQRRVAGHWAGKGFWAIMDQGLFALSNFALNVLLARWLTPTDYGAFSIAYTIFLLFGALHTSVLTEPMMVFGPGKYKERLQSYLGILLRGHWAFALVIASLFALTGFTLWRLGPNPLTPAIFGLAVATPFILFQWLMRRACYVSLQPKLAACAGALYMALIATSVLALYHLAWLGVATVLVAMAGSSLGSGLWLVYQLRAVAGANSGSDLARESLIDHWRYGRWAIGTAVLMWFPGNSFLLFLSSWWGLEASAAYRAILNLLLPIMNITTALGGVLLPLLVRARARQSFGRTVFRFTILFLAGPIIYWLLLGVFGEYVLHLLYDSKYGGNPLVLWLAGLIPVMAAISNVGGAALRALELPNLIFFTYACSATVALTAGLALVHMWGVQGSFIGWLLTYAVTASVMGISLRRRYRLRRVNT